MRVGKVSNLNFSGLWSEKQTDKIGYKNGLKTPIHAREIIYHPFSDETREEIKEAMEKAYINHTFACYSNDTINYERTPIYYVIQTPKLGERIGITKEDYAKIANMREKNEPTSSQFISYHAEEVNPNLL